MWEVICDKIADAVERNVRNMTNMTTKSKPIWMTYEAQKAVKAKNHNSWKRYARSKQHCNFEDFKESEIKLPKKSGEQW